MKNLKLTAIALACTLSLTGCGGGSSDSSGNNNGNPPAPTPAPVMTNLERAKDLVQTAHEIVNDAKDIQAAYSPVLETLNGPALEGMNVALGFVSSAQLTAFAYGVVDNVSDQLTGSEIDQEFNEAGAPYFVTASDNATISTTSNGDFVINGTFKIKELQYSYYDYRTNQSIDEYGPEVTFTANNVKVLGSNVDTVSKTFQTTISNQGSMTVTENNQTIKLSFDGSGQNTVTETYPTAKSYRTRMIEWDQQDSLMDDQIADKVVVALDGVTLASTAPVATIKVDSLKLNIDKKFMTIIDSNGAMTNQQSLNLTPTSVALIGQFKMPTPSTDLSINAKIDLDPNTQFLVNESDDLVEDRLHFVKGTFSASVKGNTLVGTKTIPLDLQLTGKRADYQAVEATNIVIKVDGRTLNATAKAAVNVDIPSTTFTLSSLYGASTTIILDNDSNLIGTTAIMVDGQSYGTISEQSSGLFSALFIDNTIIVL